MLFWSLQNKTKALKRKTRPYLLTTFFAGHFCSIYYSFFSWYLRIINVKKENCSLSISDITFAGPSRLPDLKRIGLNGHNIEDSNELQTRSEHNFEDNFLLVRYSVRHDRLGISMFLIMKPISSIPLHSFSPPTSPINKLHLYKKEFIPPPPSTVFYAYLHEFIIDSWAIKTDAGAVDVLDCGGGKGHDDILLLSRSTPHRPGGFVRDKKCHSKLANSENGRPIFWLVFLCYGYIVSSQPIIITILIPVDMRKFIGNQVFIAISFPFSRQFKISPNYKK